MNIPIQGVDVVQLAIESEPGEDDVVRLGVSWGDTELLSADEARRVGRALLSAADLVEHRAAKPHRCGD